MSDSRNDLPSPFKRVLPESLKVGKDRIVMRLDFYTEAIIMQNFDRKGGGFKMVSAYDIAHAMANQLAFGSGILPGDANSMNTLWWSNDGAGPMVALWMPPDTRKVALQTDANKPPKRYEIPLPGLIFLCRPGRAPAVYAATHRPTDPKDRAYKAPLANVYNDGRTCPGSHKYPANIDEIPDSFFRSFFTRTADLDNRSKKFPSDITNLWKSIDKEKEYPTTDLIYHGTVADLMSMRISL